MNDPRVDQYNLHSCSLACIESILRDNGVTYSQAEMLTVLLSEISEWKENPGKTAPEWFERVFEEAGFPVMMIQPETLRETIDHFPTCIGAIVGQNEKWAWVDGTKIPYPNYHAVRLLQVSMDGFKVMNPGYPPVQSAIEEWPLNDLIELKTRIYLFFRKEVA